MHSAKVLCNTLTKSSVSSKCKDGFESSTDLMIHEENVHKRSIEREPSIRSKPPKSKKWN